MLKTHEKIPTLVNTGIFTAKCDQSGTRMKNMDKEACFVILTPDF